MPSSNANDKGAARGPDLKPKAKAKVKQGNSWFIGIGINGYDHCRDLDNAHNDIHAFTALFQSQYQFDKFEFLFDDKATREGILDFFQNLKTQEDDKVLIYFAGHGHLDAKRGGYWIPKNGNPKRLHSLIKSSTIRDEMASITARHVLLISDSCFSGDLLVKSRSSAIPPSIENMERQKSRWVFTSGRQQETVLDGPPGSNSPFAQTLLKVLKDNQEKAVNIVRLADEVKRQISFKYAQEPQCKELYQGNHEGGEYVFWLRQTDNKEEAKAWEKAKKENSLTAYNKFLDVHLQGQFADEAIARIREIEEQSAWKKTEKINQIYAYRAFIKKFPEGPLAAEALKRIKKIKITKSDIIPPTQLPEATIFDMPSVSSFTDDRNGYTYPTIIINDLEWMAANLAFDTKTAGCWAYDNISANIPDYGLLYNWEALQQAIPKGWKLPSDEDWQALLTHFGGYQEDLSRKHVGFDIPQAYRDLIKGGSSNFNATLGGEYQMFLGSFSFKEKLGYYWSDTPTKNGIICYQFDGNQRKVIKFEGDKEIGFSCRCVRIPD
jgi:uncharacterized protein (TIGR02145 family)